MIVIIHSIIENMALFASKMHHICTFSQTELATQYTGGVHQWIKQHKSTD